MKINKRQGHLPIPYLVAAEFGLVKEGGQGKSGAL